MVRLIATVTLALLSMVPASASAQELVPKGVLPPVSAFGVGWTVAETSFTPADPTAISQLYSGVYLGPAGSRATVLVARIPEGPAAARNSWGIMRDAFTQARVTIDVNDDGQESDMARLPVVPGCAEMERVNGADEAIPDIAAGVSLCAADPDALILTYASGEINGLQGYQASDALVAMVLNQSAQATPTAP